MSMYTAFQAASRTIKVLLEQRLQADPDLMAVTVSLKTPKEMGQDKGISLWLYRIVRNEFLLNNPPERVYPNKLRRVPLPFGLHYLVTPLLGDSEAEQKVLGKVVQTLYDHPVSRGMDLQGSLEATSVELRASLETLSLEEITRIWTALNSPGGYQLCVSYEVQVIEIDSALEAEQVEPVVEVEARYHVMTSA
jgi:hypothetical protein